MWWDIHGEVDNFVQLGSNLHMTYMVKNEWKIALSGIKSKLLCM